MFQDIHESSEVSGSKDLWTKIHKTHQKTEVSAGKASWAGQPHHWDDAKNLEKWIWTLFKKNIKLYLRNVSKTWPFADFWKAKCLFFLDREKCDEFDKDCSGKPRCGWRRQKVAELLEKRGVLEGSHKSTWEPIADGWKPGTIACFCGSWWPAVRRRILSMPGADAKTERVIMVMPPFPTSWGNESKFKISCRISDAHKQEAGVPKSPVKSS